MADEVRPLQKEQKSRRQFIKDLSILTVSAVLTPGIYALLRKTTSILTPGPSQKEYDEIMKKSHIHAFRLTDEYSLLNLEFYFMNCVKKGDKIWAKYGPHESYMIVRLPQQHMIEKSFNDGEIGNLKASICISGFSYLVFRILFPKDNFFKSLISENDGERTHIILNRKELLDWNNEDRFRLVVRQDLTESLFQLATSEYYTEPEPDELKTNKVKLLNYQQSDSASKVRNKNKNDSIQTRYNTDSAKYKNSNIENHYPFQTSKILKGKTDSLKIDAIPKVYGDPITAIELPWRLIISPKLPDSSRFRFKWDIPDTLIDEDIVKGNRYRLWTATLSIAERSDTEYLNRKINDGIKKQNQVSSTGNLDVVINQLEFMILGSPDFPNIKTKGPDFFPSKNDRHNLVALYIKLKILAQADKLTFSPLGASIEIHLKNNLLEKGLIAGIPLIEWHQVISLGRDEKVEVSSLFLEAEFGHKMAYIETVQRELRNGSYVLIRKPYIVPLDFEKDYTNHDTQTTTIDENWGITSKFNSPFKLIRFLDIKPKQCILKIFEQSKINFTKTFFEFEAVDWHNNQVKFKKEINALPFGAAFSKIKEDADGAKTTIFKSLVEADTITKASNDSAKGFAADKNLKLEFKSTKDIASEYHQLDSLAGNNIKNLDALLLAKRNFEAAFSKSIELTFAQMDHKNGIDSIKEKFEEYFQELNGTKTNITVSLQDIVMHLIKKHLFTNGVLNAYIYLVIKKWEKATTNRLVIANENDFLNVITLSGPKGTYELILDSFLDFLLVENPNLCQLIQDLRQLTEKIVSSSDLVKNLVEKLNARIQLVAKLDEIVKEIPNIILLHKQKIGYALKEKLNEVEGELKKSLSELDTEYIIFKGALRQGENNAFNFFYEHAIIPQVEQAKVYVSAINKLVGEDIPISINYAKEYLENQVEALEFEVKQNTAMLFAEVQQYSRDRIKGLVQKLGDKMPGLNVEFPAHYLTYLKHPGMAKDDFLKQLPGLTITDEIKRASRDLIFISEGVKDTIKTIDDIRNVDPKKYFKDLGAKLFGSIRLEDILDVGFDLPRTTELPDRIIYQFTTDKFQNHRAAFVSFKPNAKYPAGNNDIKKTELNLFISKSLKNISECFSYVEMNNFSVGVVIGDIEVITVIFKQFKITSSPGLPKKTDMGVDEVKLGGPLQFIADIAAKFMAPGNGMRIKAGPKNLEAFYGITLPNISAPAFNFKNLQFSVGMNVPYDPGSLQPISFNFGLNSVENKFLVSAGIYGGRGHFLLNATPKGIDRIDIAIEMGAYAGIDFGIGKGEVFLFFGLWFVGGKDNDNNNIIKAVAYVLCSGSATVFGFITIGVSILLAMTYLKKGSQSVFYGEAIVTYSVKVAFFKKTFSLRYYKEFVGSMEGNQEPSTSVQESSVLGSLGFLFKNKREKRVGEENREFEDVFSSQKELDTYIDCFI